MITIDLQDDDASRTKKVNRLGQDQGRRQHQPDINGEGAKLINELGSQSQLGLIARFLKFLTTKE